MNRKKRWGSMKTGMILVALVIAVVAVALLIIRYYPMIDQVMSEELRRKLEAFLDRFGMIGIVVLFLLQILQVGIAIIPAEPVEIVSGMTYGAFWGTIICMVGVFVGSALVFTLVKRYGTPVVEFLRRNDRKHRLDFFNNAKRLETIVFIVYLIPAMPKDVLTYMAALTPISRANFLLISTVARLPSIVMSTFAGAAFIDGNYLQAIIVFLSAALLGMLGFLFRDKILHILEKK